MFDETDGKTTPEKDPAPAGEKLTIDLTELESPEESRFQRFSLIGWWDQEKLRNAKVLVVGAGALGNEIVKNLALLGIGNILIADLDRIENSNLSRSVLYRKEDNGASKAETAARSAKEIYPEMNVRAFHGNVLHDFGAGVYHWADVVLGGLDNREARLSINRNCLKLNKPWIDGAIEQISGVARVFEPDGPCYECTMSEMDWVLLNKRRSCNLLTRSEMELGKTPTTSTISSIIAGVQCQEAVKLLHGMETIAGKGFVFNGISADSYLIEYQRKEDCWSHDTADRVISLERSVRDMTVRELLETARKDLGTSVQLEFNQEILEKMTCAPCGEETEAFIPFGKATAENAICPKCGKNRILKTFFTVTGEETWLDRTLKQCGLPFFDIVWARTESELIGYEMSADRVEYGL